MHSTFADFVLFLYVHMAHADGHFHSEEVHVILEKMSRIYPNGTNLNEKLNGAIKEYESLKPEAVMTFIKDSFKHFNHVKFAQKYKVYTDMYDIINADGKVDESETDALASLKEIIDMGTEK